MSDALGAGTARRPTFLAEYADLVRVVVLVGVPVGALAIGLGGRLAMLLLRLTSPSDVIGVTSDDGFEIGRFTLAGTYNLVNVGVAVGLIGALACVAVSPWLIGPAWFRATTVGLTAGALVGSMIIHADGVDFTRPAPAVARRRAVPRPARAGRRAAPAAGGPRDPPRSQRRRGGRAGGCPLRRWCCSPGGVAAVAIPVLLGAAVLVLLGRTVLPPLHRSGTGTLAVRAAFLVDPRPAGAGAGPGPRGALERQRPAQRRAVT